MTLLRVEHLHRSFGGVHAVHDVSFSLAAGEILALIGPNGAGKSTTFNLLNGQLRPDAGAILLDGTDVAGWTPRRIWRQGVGRSFQVTATFASMTVRENVQTALAAFHGETWRFLAPASSRNVARADALLARVGLAALADEAASTLAYGDLKRLDLALAIANRPRLVLMDEPTAGMTLADRVAVMRLLRAEAAEAKIAVLFTEHDMEAVFGTADRVMVMDRGRIIASGPPAAIRGDARVRTVYLGESG